MEGVQYMEHRVAATARAVEAKSGAAPT
jgi:hypothetical protein